MDRSRLEYYTQVLGSAPNQWYNPSAPEHGPKSTFSRHPVEGVHKHKDPKCHDAPTKSKYLGEPEEGGAHEKEATSGKTLQKAIGRYLSLQELSPPTPFYSNVE